MESQMTFENSTEVDAYNGKEIEVAKPSIGSENGGSPSTSNGQEYQEHAPGLSSDSDYDSPVDFERFRSDATRRDKDIIKYLPLHKAAIKGDWGTAKIIFDIDPKATAAPITVFKETALHVAVGTGLNTRFVKNLVDLMTPESLEMKDSNGDTPLHNACVVGNTEAAKILVKKNPELPQLANSYNNDTPIHCAAAYGCLDTVRFLLSVTSHPVNNEASPFTGKSGLRLLNLIIMADFYDIALYLVRNYPSLAVEQNDEGYTALHTLAQKPHAFESGSHLGLFEWLLYKCIPLKNAEVRRCEDIENPTAAEIRLNHPGSKSWKIKCVQRVYDTKLMHSQSIELVKFMCKEAIKCSGSEARSLLGPPILQAAQLGIHELVKEVIKIFPSSLWFVDDCSRNIFHLAVIYRKEKIFNLLYQMSLLKNYAVSTIDPFDNNNILHLAGKLEPSNRISGAALQMQRELQWFQEVEKAVQPSFKEHKNLDEQTPQMVFTEAHKELVKQGEQWMKNTASSCTVVAALVATVAFAAAFTVPGGNTSDKGTPIFLTQLSFIVFAVSDALALFSSSASVLMFLDILISRYSEQDFLKALPMRLIIGLGALFVSIASMLAAFSASLHIVLVHRIKWVTVPIGLLACVPVTLFALMQFRLLVVISTSTFGRSIFRQQDKEIIY